MGGHCLPNPRTSDRLGHDFAQDRRWRTTVSSCEEAVPVAVWCAALAEYRLDDLARISGVELAQIRAIPGTRPARPAAAARADPAFYDDYHLSQLNTINQLLRKGFNSVHIAEFFARMREGHELGGHPRRPAGDSGQQSRRLRGRGGSSRSRSGKNDRPRSG